MGLGRSSKSNELEYDQGQKNPDLDIPSNSINAFALIKINPEKCKLKTCFKHKYAQVGVISNLSLDHSWPLCSEHLHRLEDVNHAFITHSFQNDAEGDEDSGPSHSSTKQAQMQNGTTKSHIKTHIHVSNHRTPGNELCQQPLCTAAAMITWEEQKNQKSAPP